MTYLRFRGVTLYGWKATLVLLSCAAIICALTARFVLWAVA